MITTILRIICISAVLAALGFSTRAADKLTAGIKQKTWSGTITETDPNEKVLKAKGILFSKTFNVPESCEFAIPSKQNASFGDLRPGHKVHLVYKDVSGVLIAIRIVQDELRYEGTVKSVDPKTRILLLNGAGSGKTFSIPEDCKIVVKNDEKGTLDNIKPGHKVAVNYETVQDALVAHRIEQKSSTFVGDLSAIDVPARTVKARQLLGNKQFHLADGCVIVRNGEDATHLSELKIGQKCTLSYEEVDGINVVNRIAVTEQSTSGQTAKSTE